MGRFGIAVLAVLLVCLTVSAAVADVAVYNFDSNVTTGIAQPPVKDLTGSPGGVIDIDVRLAAKRSGQYPSYPAPIRVLESFSYTAGLQHIESTWLSTPGLAGGVASLSGPASGSANGTVGPSTSCIVRLSIPTSALQGSYAVLISSKRDSGGNNPSPGTGFQIRLTIGDTAPPTIASVHLADTIVRAGTSIPIEVNAADNLGVTSVTANGVALGLTSGSAQSGLWSGLVSTSGLSEGSHGVTVVATDASGKTATDTSASFVVDNTAPLITISGVEDNKYYAAQVTPIVAVTDTNLASSSITLNGQPFTSGSSVTSDGSYTLAASGTDQAGNSASATISFVIDTQAPTISIVGAADGDYRMSFESISYSVTDANADTGSLSATLTRSVPAPDTWLFESGSSVTEEGIYTLLVQASDLAGNSAQKSISFTADSTAPELTLLSPVSGPYGFIFNSPQTISYQVFDALDPEPFFTDRTKLVSQTADGDTEQPLANDAVVSDDGRHQATIEGSDHADNTASLSVDMLIDTAAPKTTITPGGISGNHGWFVSPVTMTMTAADPDIRAALAELTRISGSGILETMCDYGEGYEAYDPNTPPAITADGVYSVTGYSIDIAGNEEEPTAIEVKIDATAPIISLDAVESPTRWNSQAVTGSYTETNLLGIDVNGIGASISGSHFSATVPLTEGNNTVVATAEDEAGHKTSAQSVVLYDCTPPVSDAVVTEGVMGLNGWYRSNVRVTLSALDNPAPGADASAGVSCITWNLDALGNHTATNPADVQVNGDAVHSLWYCATDLATNVETDKTLELKIDSTNPQVTASCSPEPNEYGWNNTDVTVTFAATDNLSGVASIDAPVSVTDEGAGIVIAGSASDAAGNAGSESATINLDKTDPAIAGSIGTVPAYVDPADVKWFGTDVQVNYTASDALSGLAAPQAADAGAEVVWNHTVTGEGAGLSDSASVTDKAGNDATAIVSGINIDRHGPAISILGVANGAAYPLGNVPAPSFSAVDSLSGPKTSSADLQKPATASGVGQYTYSVSATDNVGNASAASAIYSVVYPSAGFSNFRQPINLDGSSVFKQGSTIPVKFQLKDANGVYVKNCVAHILYAKVSDGVAGTYLEATSTSAADTGNTFRYDLTGNQYIFNLSTKSMSAGTWFIRAVLDDGSCYDVRISLKR